MQFSIIAAITFLAGTAFGLGDPSTLYWDPVYSTPTTPVSSLACTGQFAPDVATLSAVPNFPMVVGTFIAEANPTMECGACYKIYYSGTGLSVHATTVDASTTGFVGSKEVMDFLTNGRATELGHIPISYLKVENSLCNTGV